MDSILTSYGNGSSHNSATTAKEIFLKIKESQEKLENISSIFSKELQAITSRILSLKLKYPGIPVKAHKKRRNQSLSYHARIYKKWIKRYGYKVPTEYAYVINPDYLSISSLQMLEYPSCTESFRPRFLISNEAYRSINLDIGLF